jgi:phosphoribosylformylglycinamidine (FGAM) synthase-like enzyme
MGTTANYKWTLPTVHSDASTWGAELNTTIGSIDAVVWNIEKVELAAVQGQVSLSQLITSRTASNPGYVVFANSTVAAGQQNRWLIAETTETESGSDAGSNLLIQNCSDTGAVKGNVVEFARANGGASFGYSVAVQGAFTAASTISVGGLLSANAGVTVTGQLAVYGNISGSTYYFGWPTLSDFLVTQTTNLRYLQWAANWYDGWN